MIALVAWTALVFARGGMDLGLVPDVVGQPSRGPIATALALVAVGVVAVVGVSRGMLGAAMATGPGRLAIGGLGGLATWEALSTLWASAPDLAWIETNRGVLYAAVLVATVGASSAGVRVLREPSALAAAISVALMPVVLWALATKVIPGIPGGESIPRLRGPLATFNGLALLVATAIPGALWVAARRRPSLPAWSAVLAPPWLAVLLVTLALTYSRSGILAMGAAAAVTIAVGPGRTRMAAAFAAAVLAAIPAVMFGLSADGLTTAALGNGARRGAGAALGLLIVLGVVLAPLLARYLTPILERIPTRVRRRSGVALLGALGALAIALSAIGLTRGGSAVAGSNTAARLGDVSSGVRREWWAEAIRSFASAPLQGNGAGSFPVTHLLERRVDILGQQPHQLTLQLATELGVVGVILFAAFLGGVVWAGVRVARRVGRGAAGPALAVVAAFVVNAQLDWSWSIPALVIPALVCAGALVGRVARTSVRESSRTRPFAPVAVVAVAATALIPLAALLLTGRAQEELARGRFADGRASARLAATLNPLDIRAVILDARGSRALGDERGRVAAAREATDRQPDNPRAWACRATALPAGPERDAADARLARLSPFRPDRLLAVSGC